MVGVGVWERLKCLRTSASRLLSKRFTSQATSSTSRPQLIRRGKRNPARGKRFLFGEDSMIACELLWKRQGVEGRIRTTTTKGPRCSPTNLIELGRVSGIYFFYSNVLLLRRNTYSKSKWCVVCLCCVYTPARRHVRQSWLFFCLQNTGRFIAIWICALCRLILT